jgi:hypothetical protein
MKFVLALTVIFGVSQVAFANSDATNRFKLRVADSSDVCFANCSSESASCKRLCPTTYNVPCLSACDNQAQACMQSCQPRR